MKSIKYIFLRSIFIIRRFFIQWRLYGFCVAFWTLVYPFYRIFGNFKPYFVVHKHKAILKFLCKHYAGIINNLSNKHFGQDAVIESQSTIWVCWWDGFETMPPLIKTCYNTLNRHAGTHPVQLITKQNYHDFISIPEYILKKVNAGIITVTHFSDILRAALLFEYGGIWIDATILVLKDISFENLQFYSLKTTTKTNSIGHIRWQGLSRNFMRFYNHKVSEINRWSGFLLAGTKNSPLFEFMRDFFYAYWKEQNDLIDYLFIDYVLAIAYDNMLTVKKMIDNVPCIDIDKFALEKNMNTEFSEEYFAQYYMTTFHKLTWKKKFNIYTKNNKLTIYGYLLENKDL